MTVHEGTARALAIGCVGAWLGGVFGGVTHPLAGLAVAIAVFWAALWRAPDVETVVGDWIHRNRQYPAWGPQGDDPTPVAGGGSE